MRLSKHNFSKSVCQFKQPGKINIEGTIYTYETHKAIFDIAVIKGTKYYQKNMHGYSNRIDSMEPIHYAIESHYNI